MATATPTITNGVNVTQLVDTIELIKKDPSLARFRSRTGWDQGGRCATEIAGFYGAGGEITRARTHTLAGDEPPVLLGSDTAPNAVEAVLHALAACISIGYGYNAAARGITIQSLRLDAEGELDLQPSWVCPKPRGRDASESHSPRRPRPTRLAPSSKSCASTSSERRPFSTSSGTPSQ